MTLKARVQAGRLVVDEPTDLPEGTVVELLPLAPGDWLDDDDLPFGLYERLVTAGLKTRLLRFDSATTRIVTEKLDATEAHATLARHIANLVAGVLQAVPQEDRAAAQTELTNQIILLLAA